MCECFSLQDHLFEKALRHDSNLRRLSPSPVSTVPCYLDEWSLKEKNDKTDRHVPRKEEKCPQLVAKRNARERRRVHAVNEAFVRLTQALPFKHARGKRISKVKTLTRAIEYIRSLSDQLQDCMNFSCDLMYQDKCRETYDMENQEFYIY